SEYWGKGWIWGGAVKARCNSRRGIKVRFRDLGEFSECHGGEVRFRHVQGEVRVRHVQGEVRFRHVQGEVRFRHVQGEVRFRHVQGEVRFRHVQGEVKVRIRVWGEVYRCVEGPVEVRH
ncbi:hypothetical protein DPEC_G00376020, partial [Dallia pectoralis]